MYPPMHNRFRNNKQSVNIQISKPLNVLLLVIFPLLLCLTGILYLHSTGTYFLSTVDPEYAYLFNGMVMADKHPDVYYADHPGTPLVVLTAVVIRVVHVFRGGDDFLADVIKNPEIYIKASLYIIILMNTALLFLLGRFVYKKTQNIWLAMLLQLIPFAHYLGLETLGRLIPESMMLIIISLWMMLMISMISSKEDVANSRRYSLAFGVLFGFSLALKLTMLPFVIFPLIILSGWKNRLLFTAMSFISFFVFAFPILFKYHAFYTWVRNIITHTGAYGGGDPGIFHWNEFYGHLKLQLLNSSNLVISLVILTVCLILYFIARKRGIHRDPLKARLGIAAILVVLFQFVITSKQFAFHYMLPSLLLTVPMIILAGSILMHLFPSLLTSLRLNLLMGICGIFILARFIPVTYHNLSQREDRRRFQQEAYLKYTQNRSHGPLIISASYYGCSAVEYALTFGIQWCGNYSPYIYDKVQSIYPSTYLYYPWSKTFYAGRSPILPSAFLQESTDYMLYIADYTTEKLDEITGLLSQNEKNMQWVVKKIYLDNSTSDALFLLQAKKD
jgi:hypothetical protein